MSMTRAGFTIGLVSVAIVAIAVRWHLMGQPLDRDEGFYAYVAQRLLDGGVPFRETFSDKPPIAFFIYAVFFGLFGQSAWAIHFGGALWVASSSVLMALLARRLFGPVSGIAAGLYYAITSAEASYQGSSINLELLLTPFALGSLVLLTRPVITHANVAAAGGLLGLSLLTKQQAIGHAVFAAVWLLVAWLSRSPRRLLDQFQQQGLLIGSALAVFGVSVLGFWLCHSLYEYIDGVLLWNLRTYVPHEAASAAFGNFRDNFLGIALANPLLYLAAFIGLVISARRPDAVRWFVPIWLVANAAAICIGWRFYRHYFLLTQPGIVLLASCAIGRAIECSLASRSRIGAIGVQLVCLAMIASPLLIQRGYFFGWSAWEHVRQLYGAESFAVSPQLAHYVAERSSPGDSIYVHGSEPQIYFYAHRRCAIRYAFIPPLTARGAAAERRQQQAFEQLRATRPRFFLALRAPMSHMIEPGASEYFKEHLIRFTRENYASVVTVSLRPDHAEFHFGSIERPLNPQSEIGSDIVVLERRD